MCGITGKLSFFPGKVHEEDIHRMNEVIQHRGPDDEGIYVNPRHEIGLGQRRLAIIDLSPAGHQPMCNEDETVWITFNGEIYNFQALKPDLEKRGHVFRSNSDTETILHLWEEYGERCVEYLRGMFAIALWDERKRKLFLARDRVGKKPLKYYIGKDGIVFASELKAFLNEPGVPKEIDFEAIHHYLTFQYVPHPLTGFQNIKKLPPAHYLTVDISGEKPIVSRPIRYWKLDYSTKLDLSEAEWEERILQKLDECVEMRMISDVPLGAFLSGGVDSSAVVAMMAKHSRQPVKTFSIGFQEASHNELEHARRIAQRFGTDHQEFIVKPNALEVLPNLVWHCEEPYADSSAVPTYYVSQLTRNHVTVALNGDGGDENFAGYPWYPVHQFTSQYYSHIPNFFQWLVLQGAKTLQAFIKNNSTYRGVRFAKGIGESANQRYLRYISYFHPEEKDAMYTDAFRNITKNFHSEDFLLRLFKASGSLNPVDQALYTDIHSYLPDDLLVKVDIAAMAVSLEARSPLLDHTFMEMAAQIPASLKIKHGEKKYIFKKALEKILPHENLYRAKMGFGVPIEHWFRGEIKDYVREILLGKDSLVQKIFQKKSLEALIHEHQNTKINHAHRLWALLTLELWNRRFTMNVN